MNKVILVGRLTRDPEIRYTQAAEPVCVAKFALAVNKRFKPKDGSPDADFINCVAFRKQAELVERFFKKGMQMGVCGSISVTNYEDNTGAKRIWTEVNVDEIEFTESRAAFESRSGMQRPDFENTAVSRPDPSGYEPDNFSAITQSIDDDDLPF